MSPSRLKRWPTRAHELTRLFRVHDYGNAIIFGHAKDGNLHFVITQSFNNQTAIDQYSYFIDDVVKLVVERFDGALKAEHGTGRNMAPFVATEWGGEAFEIMRELKRFADPEELLNPGGDYQLRSAGAPGESEATAFGRAGDRSLH